MSSWLEQVQQSVQEGRFVELFTDSSKLTRGLKSAEKDFTAWGKRIKTAGLGISAAGAAVGVPMFAALKSFANAGSELNDMSARTGESVEQLSLLQFAAAQTGTDMAAVESGTKKLDNTLADAVSGNKAAAKSFSDIGLNASELINLPLGEKLAAVGGAFDKIQNPALKGASAVDVLGKAGRNLIPFLQEMGPLMQRASDLRLGWTTEETQLADATGDRFDELTASFWRTAQAVGSKLAPAFLGLTEPIVEVVGLTRDWIDENPQLITAIAAGAAGLTVLGGSLVAVGYTVTYAGAALGALTATVGAIGGVMPIAIGAIGYFAANSDTASYAAMSLAETIPGIGSAAEFAAETASNAWGVLVSDAQATGTQVVTAWGGIVDATSAGDLGLAAEIAMAGLNAAWLTGTQTISDTWSVASHFVLDTFDATMSGLTAFASNFMTGWSVIWVDIASAAENALTRIKKTADKLTGAAIDLKTDVQVAMAGFDITSPMTGFQKNLTDLPSTEQERLNQTFKEQRQTDAMDSVHDQTIAATNVAAGNKKFAIVSENQDALATIEEQRKINAQALENQRNQEILDNQKRVDEAKAKLAGLANAAGNKADAAAQARKSEADKKKKLDKDIDSQLKGSIGGAGAATFSGLASSMSRAFPDFSTLKTPATATGNSAFMDMKARLGGQDVESDEETQVAILSTLQSIDQRIAAGGTLTA